MKNILNRLLLSTVAILLVSLVGCTGKPERVEYWMSYDDIDLMASPSDTAAVVKQLNGRVSPFDIEQRDSTGAWGLYVISRGTFSKTVSGWLPLKEMIYAGSDDPGERMETFVVKSKELPVYKHPKVNKKDCHGTLHMGDTVLATAKSGNWIHMYYTKFGQTGRQRKDYGWVQASQLQKIDSLTRDGLREQKLASSVTARAGGKEDAAYLEARQKHHKVYQSVAVVIGYIGMAIALGLLVFAIRRKKFWDVVVIFIMGLLIVGLSQAIEISAWYFAFFLPLMAYIVTYPLLYINKTSRLSTYVFPVLALLAVAGYLMMNTNILHPTFWRVLWFIVLAGACTVETFWIRNRKEKDICPHCGYYGKHTTDGREQTGSTTSYGTAKEDQYLNTTRETVGNTEYITKHYNRVTYDTKKTTRFYDVHRTCMHCGQPFLNFEESTTTSKTKRS